MSLLPQLTKPLASPGLDYHWWASADQAALLPFLGLLPLPGTPLWGRLCSQPGPVLLQGAAAGPGGDRRVTARAGGAGGTAWPHSPSVLHPGSGAGAAGTSPGLGQHSPPPAINYPSGF